MLLTSSVNVPFMMADATDIAHPFRAHRFPRAALSARSLGVAEPLSRRRG